MVSKEEVSTLQVLITDSRLSAGLLKLRQGFQVCFSMRFSVLFQLTFHGHFDIASCMSTRTFRVKSFA